MTSASDVHYNNFTIERCTARPDAESIMVKVFESDQSVVKTVTFDNLTMLDNTEFLKGLTMENLAGITISNSVI